MGLLLNEARRVVSTPALGDHKAFLTNTSDHSMNSRSQKIAIKDCILFLKLRGIEKKHHEITRQVFPPKQFDPESKLHRQCLAL